MLKVGFKGVSRGFGMQFGYGKGVGHLRLCEIYGANGAFPDIAAISKHQCMKISL